MHTRTMLLGVVCCGLVGTLLWARPARAQPFPGGLPQCEATVTTCNADLATCATNLGTCTTDLTQTQADLATCQADLAVCQAEMQGAFPGDGVTGPALSYWDNGDGTITDLNTRLMWEKKVEGSGCLHCMDDVYTQFPGTGMWINDVNVEGGTGFAGHNDWRLPNVRELHSIVDYGEALPAIHPAFGPTAASSYWSSTVPAFPTFAAAAWHVNFATGTVPGFSLLENAFHVRAVRGPFP